MESSIYNNIHSNSNNNVVPLPPELVSFIKENNLKITHPFYKRDQLIQQQKQQEQQYQSYYNYYQPPASYYYDHFYQQQYNENEYNIRNEPILNEDQEYYEEYNEDEADYYEENENENENENNQQQYQYVLSDELIEMFAKTEMKRAEQRKQKEINKKTLFEVENPSNPAEETPQNKNN